MSNIFLPDDKLLDFFRAVLNSTSGNVEGPTGLHLLKPSRINYLEFFQLKDFYSLLQQRIQALPSEHVDRLLNSTGYDTAVVPLFSSPILPPLDSITANSNDLFSTKIQFVSIKPLQLPKQLFSVISHNPEISKHFTSLVENKVHTSSIRNFTDLLDRSYTTSPYFNFKKSIDCPTHLPTANSLLSITKRLLPFFVNNVPK